MIDGIRHVEILELLEQLITPDRLIHVHVEAPDQVRQSRIETRNRSGEGADLATLESHSTERQVLDGLPQRAAIVVNSGDDMESIVSSIRRAM